jgi:hypothetical protein
MPEYEPLPTTPTDDTSTDSDDETSDGENAAVHEHPPARARDIRFEQPVPSPWKRAGLIVLIFFLFWLAIVLRKASSWSSQQPKVVYASRYVYVWLSRLVGC